MMQPSIACLLRKIQPIAEPAPASARISYIVEAHGDDPATGASRTMSSEERGKRLLKDLNQSVRQHFTPTGTHLVEQRGLAIIEELIEALTGPDGMPGLKLWRDAQSKFRVQRALRSGEIGIEWQSQIGALLMTVERVNYPKKQSRYVFDERDSRWKPLSGGGELYEDLTASLIETFYPEGRK